jgi:protein-tyrosine phosphatase
MKQSVLFVCLGNICRSPAAEGVFLAMVRKAGLHEQIFVDSCGTGAWHVGDGPDNRMIHHAAKRGYDLRQLEARQFKAPEDFRKFDLILTMDQSNLKNILSLDTKRQFHGKVKPLVSFCQNHSVTEVPDPYYREEDGFELVLDLIEDACAQLLKQLADQSRQLKSPNKATD